MFVSAHASRPAQMCRVSPTYLCARSCRLQASASPHGSDTSGQKCVFISRSSLSSRCASAGAAHAAACPTLEEDRAVAHAAFMGALKDSRPAAFQIPNLMEFAGALVSRACIPSQRYADPLMHIFEEFDADGDGQLTAAEIGRAFRSRNVRITDQQVELFVERAFPGSRGSVTAKQFRDLVYRLAAADPDMRAASLGRLRSAR